MADTDHTPGSKHIEERLLEQERRYRMLAEHATDMISTHTPDGRYTYASPACRRLFGYEPEELVGRSAYDFFDTRDLPAVNDSHEKVLTANDISTVTYRIRHRNGRSIWIETTSKNVRDEQSGLVREIIAISRDVTHRREIIQRLEEARETAESASRAKTEFLANMSHEIRTPLNAILGYADLIARDTQEPTSADYARTIQSAGSTLLRLLSDLLDLSQVEAGRLSLAAEPVDLHRLLHEIYAIFAPRAEQKDLTLDLGVDQTVPQHALLDGQRLRQIMINLVSNAIKFTDDGLIRIHVCMSGETDGVQTTQRPMLVVTVEDTGKGIPPEAQGSIFDPFDQGPDDPTSRRNGVGLGLAITRRLVDLFGGTLTLESKVGNGSRFTVRIPFTPTNDDTPDIEPAGQPSITFPTVPVVVADDEASNLKLLSTWARRAGLVPLEIIDNAEVPRTVAEHHPAAVLLDLRRGDTDGSDVIQQIRAGVYPNTPVIAVSGTAGERHDGDFDGWLVKPVNYDELTATLARFIQPLRSALEPPEPQQHASVSEHEVAAVTERMGPDLHARLDRLRRVRIVDELAAFADELVSAARHVGVPRLREQGEALQSACRRFDIDAMTSITDELSVTLVSRKV